jgi:hypothetical protein
MLRTYDMEQEQTRSISTLVQSRSYLVSRGREEKERGKEDIDSLDMEEDSLGLQYRIMDEVFLAVDCFELDIAKSAIDEWSHVVRGIIVGDWGVCRSRGGGDSRRF